MNIELKPIAESKIRQLGGDVCGVLVRKDEKLAAVDEHGRVQWLDSWGEAARAQGGQGAEPVGFVQGGGLEQLDKGHPAKIYPVDATPSPFESHKMLYTHPQPAVPEAMISLVAICQHLRDHIDERGTSLICHRGVTLFIDALQNAEAVTEALLSTPTTPQADGWVSCEDRLPEPRRQSRKAPNGILAKHEGGRITQFRDVTETLLQYMRNGPRKPTKFEQPVGERITEWMDLDAVQEGE